MGRHLALEREILCRLRHVRGEGRMEGMSFHFRHRNRRRSNIRRLRVLHPQNHIPSLFSARFVDREPFVEKVRRRYEAFFVSGHLAGAKAVME